MIIIFLFFNNSYMNCEPWRCFSKWEALETLSKAAQSYKSIWVVVRQRDMKSTQVRTFTCSLVVQSHHVTASCPQRVGVVVGRLHTLAFRVDPTERFPVVEKEVSGATLSRRLVLDKRADLFVVVVVWGDWEAVAVRSEWIGTNGTKNFCRFFCRIISVFSKLQSPRITII